MTRTRIAVRKDQAFTLIEMSIVLVIIGILTGGILIGHTMVRSSQVNSVWIDVRKYSAAVNSFKDQYHALPGDYTQAVQIWGAAGENSSDNYTSSCYGNVGTGTRTCNGTGFGSWNASNCCNEQFLAWKHLANAGLVEGTYSGLNLATVIPGVNVPQARITGTGFTFWDNGTGVYSNANWYSNYYGQFIMFGLPVNNGTSGPALTAMEAALLDQKYDDGLPATGSIVGTVYGTSTAPNCTTSATPSVAQYNISVAGPVCSLAFINIAR